VYPLGVVAIEILLRMRASSRCGAEVQKDAAVSVQRVVAMFSNSSLSCGVWGNRAPSVEGGIMMESAGERPEV
jgi:hypothetical protein